MGSRTLFQIILMAFFFYFVNMQLNYSKFEVNVLGAEYNQSGRPTHEIRRSIIAHQSHASLHN